MNSSELVQGDSASVRHDCFGMHHGNRAAARAVGGQLGNPDSSNQPSPATESRHGPTTRACREHRNTNHPSLVDQSFLRKTMEDDAAQVQMGQLAQQKSASDDVKQYGRKWPQIHEQLTDQLKPVAKKLGVDEPKRPSKKDKAGD